MSKKETLYPNQSISMLQPKDSHMSLNPEDSVSSAGFNPQARQQQQQYMADQYRHSSNYPPQTQQYYQPPNPQTHHQSFDYGEPAQQEYFSQESSRAPLREPSQLSENPFSEANSGSTHSSSRPSRNGTRSHRESRRSKSNRQSRVNENIERANTHQPWFSYSVSILHVITLIIGLVMNKDLTGNLIAPITQNYMIGPAPIVLIREGARYVPCMRKQLFTTLNTTCPLPNGQSNTCFVDELCGLTSGNQWYRLLLPIFLHAGIIHLLCNFFFQVTLLKDLEIVWGGFLILPIFMISGSFSFLFGAAYSSNAAVTPSVGSSGALFGITAALVINLLIHWKSLHKPIWQLVNLIVVIIVSILLGVFVPFIDNYAHIGGFIMGIGNSLLFAPYESVRKTLRRIGVRKSLIFSLWFPWVCRFVGVVWTVVLYSVVLNDFYSNSSSCSFCGNLSK